MARVPHSSLHYNSNLNIVFAGRGPEILLFSSGICRWSWRHPEYSKWIGGGKPSQLPALLLPDADEEGEGQERPAKRRRAEPGRSEESPEAGRKHPASPANGSVTKNPPGQGSEPGQRNSVSSSSSKKQQLDNTATDIPFVQSLVSSRTGGYLVAVTGADKTIWVFGHCDGQLKLLSCRVMPKRPCSVALTADEKSILSADKFGDVYALPLLEEGKNEDDGRSEGEAKTTNVQDVPAPAAAPAPAPAPAPAAGAPVTTAAPATALPAQRAPFRPQATELTVHTERNRRALENQKRGLEEKSQQQQRAAAAAAEADEAKGSNAGAASSHTPYRLLLGHVSMLTAVLAATQDSGPAGGCTRARPFIITADRDEHIRVSRGVPGQEHVIEHFCLGHREFVSRLCLVPGMPGMLVSGGGDPDLFVWNWQTGRLLFRGGLLGHVQEIVPGAEKVALNALAVWEHPISSAAAAADSPVIQSRFVVAACERVPALFLYKICDNGLEHRATIRLPGHPLDVVCLRRMELVVAMRPIIDDATQSTASQSPAETRHGDDEWAGMCGKDWSPESSLLLLPERHMMSLCGPSVPLPEEGANGGNWHFQGPEAATQIGLAIGEEELQKVLFPNESLRKMAEEASS